MFVKKNVSRGTIATQKKISKKSSIFFLRANTLFTCCAHKREK